MTVSHGKPYAGKPHVRFDEGAGVPGKGRPALLHELKWWSRDYGDAAERRSSFALRASTFAEATVDKPEDKYDRGDQAT